MHFKLIFLLITSLVHINIFAMGDWDLHMYSDPTSHNLSLITCAAFSPCGKYLISGSSKGEVIMCNFQDLLDAKKSFNNKIRAHCFTCGNDGRITNFVFSPCGTFLAFVAMSHSEKLISQKLMLINIINKTIHEIYNESEKNKTKNNFVISSVDFSPCGKFLAFTKNNAINEDELNDGLNIIDLKTLKCLYTFASELDFVNFATTRIKYSLCGKYILRSYFNSNFDSKESRHIVWKTDKTEDWSLFNGSILNPILEYKDSSKKTIAYFKNTWSDEQRNWSYNLNNQFKARIDADKKLIAIYKKTS